MESSITSYQICKQSSFGNTLHSVDKNKSPEILVGHLFQGINGSYPPSFLLFRMGSSTQVFLVVKPPKNQIIKSNSTAR